jgi:hypothetical protein
MELTIATVNELLLPPFLFVVTFCFLCCQLPGTRTCLATPQPEAEAIAIPQPHDEPSSALEILKEQEPVPARRKDEELQADLWETPVVEESVTLEPQAGTLLVEDKKDVPVEEHADETITSSKVVAASCTAQDAEADLKPEPGANQQPEVYAQVLAAIDGLGKREARKMMGGLKLQQKRNGVELSTELMVASIRREFKTSPERVIEVMSDRLPELLPATADPQQKAC